MAEERKARPGPDHQLHAIGPRLDPDALLPPLDPDAADEAAVTVRGRLTHMLDVAYNLGLSQGAAHAMARQKVRAAAWCPLSRPPAAPGRTPRAAA